MAILHLNVFPSTKFKRSGNPAVVSRVSLNTHNFLKSMSLRHQVKRRRM